MSRTAVQEGPWLAADLESLARAGEPAARAAFDQLWGETRPGLVSQFARWGLVGAEAQDAAQDVGLRVWRARGSVRARSVGQWQAYVRQVAYRVLASRGRAEERADAELLEEIPADEMSMLDAFLTGPDATARIVAAADDLWLGAADPADDVSSATLAATLVLSETMAPEAVASMLGVSPGEVRRHLGERAIVARAAFRTLCWPCDEVAGYVLRPESPVPHAGLDALTNGMGEAPTTDWTREDAAIVVRRLRYGMTLEGIARTQDRPMGEVAGALDRVRAALPFGSLGVSFRERLRDWGMEAVLADPRLWKRIVFELHARQDQCQGAILDLVGPAAEVGGYRITAKTLENWLSDGRLYRQLASALEER